MTLRLKLLTFWLVIFIFGKLVPAPGPALVPVPGVLFKLFFFKLDLSYIIWGVGSSIPFAPHVSLPSAVPVGQLTWA